MLTSNAETSEMLKALWKIKLEFGPLAILVFHLIVIFIWISLFELNTCKPAVKYQKIETFTFFMICTNFTLTFLSSASLWCLLMLKWTEIIQLEFPFKVLSFFLSKTW